MHYNFPTFFGIPVHYIISTPAIITVAPFCPRPLVIDRAKNRAEPKNKNSPAYVKPNWISQTVTIPSGKRCLVAVGDWRRSAVLAFRSSRPPCSRVWLSTSIVAGGRGPSSCLSPVFLKMTVPIWEIGPYFRGGTVATTEGASRRKKWRL